MGLCELVKQFRSFELLWFIILLVLHQTNNSTIRKEKKRGKSKIIFLSVPQQGDHIFSFLYDFVLQSVDVLLKNTILRSSTQLYCSILVQLFVYIYTCLDWFFTLLCTQIYMITQKLRQNFRPSPYFFSPSFLSFNSTEK